MTEESSKFNLYVAFKLSLVGAFYPVSFDCLPSFSCLYIHDVKLLRNLVTLANLSAVAMEITAT